MPSRARKSAQDARFVFRGTVKRLRAATLAEMKKTPRTAIVRVDEVIRAPHVLSQCAGQDITVDLAGPDTLQAGQQATFYASGWVFGDTIAVQATDHAPVEARHVAMARAASDPVANLRSHDAKTRFDRASVVVSGQVVSVNLPAATTTRALTSAAATSDRESYSEHVALWRDAVIEVHAVHKGSHSGKRATVRFPASTDVMWHRAPKFHAGQEGFFMLHRDEARAITSPKMALAAAGAERAYTALHPADYQPFDEAGGVRTLVDAASATTRSRRPRRRR